MIPLGKGFFEFKFNYVEDMRRIWALGVMNLKPGILRFFCWIKDFTPQNQVQSHSNLGAFIAFSTRILENENPL